MNFLSTDLPVSQFEVDTPELAISLSNQLDFRNEKLAAKVSYMAL